MTLQEKLEKYHIILASNSPRRKQYLADLNINFEVKPSNVDESYPITMKGYEIASYIAEQKASSFINLKPNDLVITCDTIVWVDGIALGKPDNDKEAYEMLTKLSNKTHEVISAVSLKSCDKLFTFFDSTEVTFKKLTHSEINYYINTYKPFDKAGSYGIQEWIGLIGIQKINGSYTNVVGMPMEKLYTHLMQW